jgi:hypothetical protein
VDASGEVLAALQTVPPEDYANRQEVTRSVPTDPATGLNLNPAQRAGKKCEPHRHPQRMAEHPRDAPKPPVEEELDGCSGLPRRSSSALRRLMT